jgi:hypothetical protein
VAKAILVAQFLRARAWWRLDTAGDSALRVARSVVSLLDTAAYLRDLPDSDPNLVALEKAGCFRGAGFDPGPEGAVVIRDWQLADEQSAGPGELLSALAGAATRTPPGGPTDPAAAANIAIPPQASAARGGSMALMPHEVTAAT